MIKYISLVVKNQNLEAF